METKISKARQRLGFVLRNTGDPFTVAEVADLLDIQRPDASKMLARWVAQGWVTRLRQGLYTPVPIKSVTGEVVLENPWVIVSVLFDQAYIGGWSAAEHWDLTEQIFSSVCVLTADKIRQKDQSIGGVRFQLTSMRTDRHFGLQTVWHQKQKIAISNPTKTIIDMVYKPTLGGGIQHVIQCLQNFRHSKHWNLEKIVDYVGLFQSGALNKRLGLLADSLGMIEIAETCANQLTSGNIQLDPKNPGTKLITRWKVFVPKHWKRWIDK